MYCGWFQIPWTTFVICRLFSELLITQKHVKLFTSCKNYPKIKAIRNFKIVNWLFCVQISLSTIADACKILSIPYQRSRVTNTYYICKICLKAYFTQDNSQVLVLLILWLLSLIMSFVFNNCPPVHTWKWSELRNNSYLIWTNLCIFIQIRYQN